MTKNGNQDHIIKGLYTKRTERTNVLNVLIYSVITIGRSYVFKGLQSLPR